MMVERVIQTTGSTCGHCCVAMIAGVTEQDVIDLIGKKKTYPRDLRKAFQSLGWNMETKSSTRLPDKPEWPSLLFMQNIIEHKCLGHWVVWTGEHYIDPSEKVAPIDSGTRGAFYRVTKAN